MSVTPENAPVRPAYIRDSASGLYYKLAVQGLPGSGSEGGGVSDHGALSGLTDDDHPQYHNDTRGDARYSVLAHNHAHDSLTGLTTGDPHTQYLNNARGDARYSALVHNHDASYLPLTGGTLTGLLNIDRGAGASIPLMTLRTNNGVMTISSDASSYMTFSNAIVVPNLYTGGIAFQTFGSSVNFNSAVISAVGSLTVSSSTGFLKNYSDYNASQAPAAQGIIHTYNSRTLGQWPRAAFQAYKGSDSTEKPFLISSMGFGWLENISTSDPVLRLKGAPSQATPLFKIEDYNAVSLFTVDNGGTTYAKGHVQVGANLIAISGSLFSGNLSNVGYLNSDINVHSLQGINFNPTNNPALRMRVAPDGQVTVAADPTVPLGVATKQYVDNKPAGITAHSALTGLSADDHPQYLNNTRGDARYSLSVHNHAHNSLTGLTIGDPHTQYHTDARGDARYSLLAHTHTAASVGAEPAGAVAAHAATAGHELLSSTTPAALGAAAVGVGTTTARADHVHAMPTAAQVGAEVAGAVANHVATADPHTQYLKKASDTMTGPLIVEDSAWAESFGVTTPVNTSGDFSLMSDWSPRWSFSKSSESETGSNAGSNFTLSRYSDAGAWIDNPLSVQRSTGIVTFLNQVWLSKTTPTAGNHAVSKAYADTVGSDYALLSLVSGWVGYIGGGSVYVVRQGMVVTLNHFFRWTGTSYTWTAGEQCKIATIPPGGSLGLAVRPKRDSSATGLFSLAGTNNSFVACRVLVSAADGSVVFYAPVAGTMPTNGGWLIINISYEPS